MKFKIQPEKPVTIEIEVDGKTSEIKFYPTDLKVRQDFFEIYEELKAYKPKEIMPVIDENGVSNIELEETRELKRLTDFVAERVDRVFGEGTSKIIMNGRYYLSELVRFICEMAQYFKAVSNSLIQEYTAPEESCVME
ncbi:MAG: hypothetical protein K2O14_11840 [Oscillospiraceae bacterium]|nr:hypothetical protein [Oscillospiraceae bacterium]